MKRVIIITKSSILACALILQLSCDTEAYKNSEFKKSYDKSGASTYVFLMKSKYHFPIKSSDGIVILSMEAINDEVIFKYDMKGIFYNMPNDSICEGMNHDYLPVMLCSDMDSYKLIRDREIKTKHIIYRDNGKDSICSISYESYKCKP